MSEICSLTQTGSTNQVTFAGNVDANNGLDVTGARVIIGTGTPSYATAAGELYVQNDLEVGGTIYGNVEGTISSIGTASLGDTTLGSLAVTGTSNLSSLTVTGTSSLQGNVDAGAGIDVTGDANFGGGTTYKV